MPIPKRLRFEILRRDNHACRYCGATAPDVALTIDHVVPEVLGGTNDPANLVNACGPCNAGKSSVPPDAPIVADVAADALRWARAMDVATIYLETERDNRDRTRAAFLTAWNGWTYGAMGYDITYAMPNDWQITIDRFAASGLKIAEIEEAIDQTMRSFQVRDRWRFFCGISWRMLGDKQKIARQVIALEDGE